jgi:hypothetical protein
MLTTMEVLRLDLSCALPHDPRVERILTAALQEIRWAHGEIRLCCGVFFRESALRVVGSSQPSTMQSLCGTCVFGDAVARYQELLEHATELSSDDVGGDPTLGDLPLSILGEDTRASLALPLRTEARTLGFVRIDARGAAAISPKAREDLRGVVDLCLLAVSLEAELVTSHQRSRQILHARRWIHQRLEREHEGIGSIRTAVDQLTRTLLEAGIDDTTRRTLGFAVEDVERRLDAFAARLDRHAEEARHAEFFPEDASESVMRNRLLDAVEMRSENARSTGEKLG